MKLHAGLNFMSKIDSHVKDRLLYLRYYYGIGTTPRGARESSASMRAGSTWRLSRERFQADLAIYSTSIRLSHPNLPPSFTRITLSTTAWQIE